MPLYEYQCQNDHRFERRVRLDGSDAPPCCPVCTAALRRVMSAPAAFPGADSWRKDVKR